MKQLLIILQTAIFFACFEISISSQYELTEPVKTNNGLIQGKLLNTVGKNVQYSSFFGIPYAKPPLGYRRFKPPEHAEAWTNIYQATQEKSICPQKNPADGSPIGHEDCLHLNVYTPKVDSNDTRLRSVMVWIHGGGFDAGTNSPNLYGPDFLIEEDVVVVAMNYRLGALGFLTLNHSDATGNAGLKDQNLALQWVQQNIRNFGGDPKKVTIFGQSAGSVSTLCHVLSDQSKGLFRSAIAMSGSPLNSWGFLNQSEAIARSLSIAKTMGIDTTNTSLLLKELYNASAENITSATILLSSPYLPFLTPTIETPGIAISPMITECTVKKFKAGYFNRVPIIIGFVDEESLPYVGIDMKSRNQFLDKILANMKNFPELLSTQEIQYLQKIRNKTENVAHLPNSDLYKLTNITSDLIFNYGIDQTERFLTAANTAPVYYYRNLFDYSQSLHRLVGIDLNGTTHADDVAHIFWLSNKNQSLDASSDIAIHRAKIVKMWTNFAKYSNPTPKEISNPLLNMTWPPSDANGTCLVIDKVSAVGPRPISNFLEYAEKVMETSLEEIL